MANNKSSVQNLSEIYNQHAEKIVALSELTTNIDEKVKTRLTNDERKFFEDTYKPLVLDFFRLAFSTVSPAKDLGLGQPEIGVYVSDGCFSTDILMKVGFIRELEQIANLDDSRKKILAHGPKGLEEKLANIQGQVLEEAHDYSRGLKSGIIKPLF